MNPVLSIDVSKAVIFLSNSKTFSKPFMYKHSPKYLKTLLSLLDNIEEITGTEPSLVIEARCDKY